MMATGKEFEVSEVGINTPKQLPIEELTVGDVGYIIASIKMLMTHVWVIQLLMLIDQAPLKGYKNEPNGILWFVPN